MDLAVATDPSVSEAAKELAICLMRSNETSVVTIDVLVRANGEPWWQVDFSLPPRVPYIKFANQDEWLAKIV